MSSDDFERRINNQLETMLEAIAELIQAGRIQEARSKENSKQIAALMEVVRAQVEVARSHDERLDRHNERLDRHNERLDRIEKMQEENNKGIAALREQGKEQDERIHALIRIVEGHISHHP